MDVLDDSRDRLVLVHDSIDAKSPDRGAAERGQEQTPHGVAECVTETSLEGLKAELGEIRIILPRHRVDEMGTDEAAEIDTLCHRQIL
ncbi:MAG: hypothetical protein NVS4B3_11800 [Gemmatimonadaceae bacterium]